MQLCSHARSLYFSSYYQIYAYKQVANDTLMCSVRELEQLIAQQQVHSAQQQSELLERLSLQLSPSQRGLVS